MTSVKNAENASPGEQPFAAQLPITKSIPPKTVLEQNSSITSLIN